MPKPSKATIKRRLNKWADALESGAYDQGQGRLVRKGKSGNFTQFCCLGVGCDIATIGEWVEGDPDHPGDRLAYKVDNRQLATSMPQPMQDYYGMDRLRPPASYALDSHADFQDYLIYLNDRDVKPANFKTIAKAIRKAADAL